MTVTETFKKFFDNEKASGLVLVFITVISIVLANSPWQAQYLSLWSWEFAGHAVVHWINEGLMTIFFLLIGLELEREIYQGELSKLKNASLPIFGALGGMLVPAGIFLALNVGTTYQSGAGIPMATDIAFAVGILSLLGDRVPVTLKIFLMALAVIDDLGAIFVIAFFYTSSLSFTNLFISLGIFGFLLVLNRLQVRNLIPYLVGGVAMWYFMLHSGVHATITGVLLAFAIPFGDGGKKSTSFILQHFLHKPVAFFILPLFAIANTCLPIDEDWQHSLTEKVSLGIIVGLVIGKPIGIWLFTVISVKLGLSAHPPGLTWKNVLGAGMLGGIGFTMSIFITLLAFDQPEIVNHSKMAILTGSVIAGVFGFLWLHFSLTSKEISETA